MNKEFQQRHIGPSENDIKNMLSVLGCASLEEAVKRTVPESIYFGNRMNLPEGLSEAEVFKLAQTYAKENKLAVNFIGQGYYDTITPAVIQRNIFENPGWYTAYTPYQAEIAQGRLEMLINYQQMVTDLTGMDISNASLLDEPTAAAEAMMMARRANKKSKSNKFIVDLNSHPQTLSVLTTRAIPLDIEIVLTDLSNESFEDCFGAFFHYPGSNGSIEDFRSITQKAKDQDVVCIFASDLMALTLIETPREMGADIVIGNSQRFGVPLGYGGPHAAFLSTLDEHKRLIPGRIIGVSQDQAGNRAFRMSLQTREQHIRRDKATSNICTAQVLLAVMAAAYAIYHGPKGLKQIASSINQRAGNIAQSFKDADYELASESFFDTVTVISDNAESLYLKAQEELINVRLINSHQFSISVDETTSDDDLQKLYDCFGISNSSFKTSSMPEPLLRKNAYLTHPVFNRFHSETEMMRYLKRLENKDIALNHSMIALGSCTMKLNAAVEMMPVSLPGFSKLHPYAPEDQTLGYQRLFSDLESQSWR